MSNADDLERALPEILDSFGVRAVPRPMLVTVSPAERCMGIRLAMPRRVVDVRINDEEVHDVEHFADLALKLLQDGARKLFADAVEHTAKHDRSPVDRLRDIERRAAELISAVSSSGGAVPSSVMNALMNLQMLMRSNPGSASWGRHGYGRDRNETDLVVAADALEQAGHVELAKRVRAWT